MVSRVPGAILLVKGVFLRNLEPTPDSGGEHHESVRPLPRGKGCRPSKGKQMVRHRTSVRGFKCGIALSAVVLTTLGDVNLDTARLSFAWI